jgi:TM2 domain-containing membrane protein YozV
MVDSYPQRRTIVAYLLWMFFGIFGAHRFYLDDYNLGFMFFITGGFCGIGWAIDGLLIADMVEHCNQIRYELAGVKHSKAH